MEVVLDYEYDGQVDLWSCGVVFYTMLNGFNPFDTPQQIVDADYDPFDIEVSVEGMDIFHDLIQLKPELRRYKRRQN